MSKAILIILDGYGIAPPGPGNAIELANPETLKRLETEVPHTLIRADSETVGLPPNTLGGSEVGHFTMGAGTVIFQSLSIIDDTIESGEFFDKEEFKKATQVVKDNDSTLHLIGMISDKGIHAHINHLFALMQFAKQQGISKVAIHAIADGRDVPERSVKGFLESIEAKIEELGLGEIIDLVGRYYAMDRDNNWDRTEQAYKLYTISEGKHISIEEASDQYNEEEDTDYYLKAKKFTDNPVKSDDAVIFFNYRTDRAKQLTDAFTLKEFDHFDRAENPLPYFVAFGDYTKAAPVAFPPPQVETNIGKYLSEKGLKQLRIAETEKYPHVTFFFNSQDKEPYEGEDRIVVDSPKVASYADAPEMSAKGVTSKVIEQIDAEKYDLIVLNYANLDLVGHSGEIDATVKATQCVDKCLGEVLKAAEAHGYSVIITGDHGNADQMYYPDSDEICPAHSMNPTRCYVITDKYSDYKVKQEGAELKDIAPTLLDLMGLDMPSSMTGTSLIEQ